MSDIYNVRIYVDGKSIGILECESYDECVANLLEQGLIVTRKQTLSDNACEAWVHPTDEYKRREAIKALLEESNPNNIPYFAYSGDLDMGVTWAWTIMTNRDADLLTRSNWEVITSDMRERFPDDVVIESMNHWVCGWGDKLAVRVLNDDGTLTEAGEAVLKWNEFIENNIMANEDHFYNLEYEEWDEYVDRELDYRHDDDMNVDLDTLKDRAYEWFRDNDICYSMEEFSDDDIDKAIEYATNPDYMMPYWKQVANGQLELGV